MTLAWLKRRVRDLLPRRPGPVILMYHRVAKVAADPWDIAVTPENFDRQMAVLKATRTPLPMSDFARRLADETLPQDAVAITFDDGYVDNLTAAKPILEAHGVPATVFLATDWIGSVFEFWWDELARAILLPSDPVQLELDLAGRPFILDIPSGPPAPGPWLAWDPPRTVRERTFVELWTALRELTPVDRAAAMAALRLKLSLGPAPAQDLPMTPQEVARLVQGDLITAGAHSMTHPVLPWLPPEDQRGEVEGSLRRTEALTGRRPTGFAYPFGEHDEVTRAAVAEAGVCYAVTTHEAGVRRQARRSPFTLPRFQALNWDDAAFEDLLVSA
jgi:peptidoglycan/xylan/chitin deacetylase (PgdA/CDA1 family)